MQKIFAQDPETLSSDIVAENVDQLKTLFPEAIVEGKIDFEVLKQLLGGLVEEREEKYGLNWHGKRRARQLALTPSTGTLRPCPEDSVDWDTTRNLMIEGDNLEVLKLLQKSYAGKVNLIYIDPPYNTGKDFVYPDNFHDNIKNYLELTGQTGEGGKKLSSNTEASGRFHTDWLNMMYPRLKLARNLLREDGVILISLDDHEAANLRQTCNEVFGEENFIACMVWEKGRKNDAKLVSVRHEYLLVYAKSQGYLRETRTMWREEKPGARDIWETYLKLRAKHGDKNDAIEADLQSWYSGLERTHPAKKWSRYKHVDANGPWRDDNISWPGGGGPTYDVVHPTTKKPCKVPERGWVYANSDTMLARIKQGIVEFRPDHSEPPIRKSHLKPVFYEDVDGAELEDENENDNSTEIPVDEEELATQVRGSYFYKQSQVTVKYFRKLMGAKAFNNPKDHFELAKLFDYVTANKSSAIALDFFAGSGSSAHAVMELNAADGGNRRYMLVQLPEPLDPTVKEQKVAAAYCKKLDKPLTIAEVTKERLRRAAKDIKVGHSGSAGDLGFRVFKLDSTNIREWDPDRDKLADSLFDSINHLKADRTEQDILFELLLKLGLDLCVPIETRQVVGAAKQAHEIHSIGGGSLLVCLSPAIPQADVEPLVLGLVAWHRALKPAGETTIVFRDSAFADDVAKTSLTAILQQHGLETVRSL